MQINKRKNFIYAFSNWILFQFIELKVLRRKPTQDINVARIISCRKIWKLCKAKELRISRGETYWLTLIVKFTGDLYIIFTSYSYLSTLILSIVHFTNIIHSPVLILNWRSEITHILFVQFQGFCTSNSSDNSPLTDSLFITYFALISRSWKFWRKWTDMLTDMFETLSVVKF